MEDKENKPDNRGRDSCLCNLPKSGDFKQVISLRNSGLTVYIHKNVEVQKTSRKKSEETFILHNTGDKELKRPDYISEMCQYKTKCVKCKTLVHKVRSLIDEIDDIKTDEVLGVCEYCKRPNTASKCRRCEYIVSKYLTLKNKVYQNKQARFVAWLTKVNDLLRNILNTETVCKHKLYRDSHSVLELEQLLTEIKSPLSQRQPEITYFPTTAAERLLSFSALGHSKEILEDILKRMNSEKLKHDTSEDSLFSSSSKSSTGCVCKYFMSKRMEGRRSMEVLPQEKYYPPGLITSREFARTLTSDLRLRGSLDRERRGRRRSSSAEYYRRRSGYRSDYSRDGSTSKERGRRLHKISSDFISEKSQDSDYSRDEYGKERRSKRDEYGSARASKRDDYESARGPKRDEYGRERLSKRDDYGRERLSKRDDYGRERLSKRDEYGRERLSKRDDYGREILSKRDEYGRERLSKRDDYGSPRASRRDDYGSPRGTRRDDYRGARGSRRDEYGGARGSKGDEYGRERRSKREDYDSDRGSRRDDYRGARGSRRDEYGGARGSKGDEYGRERRSKREDYDSDRGSKRDDYGKERASKRDENGSARRSKRDEYEGARGSKRDDYESARGSKRDEYGKERGLKRDQYGDAKESKRDGHSKERGSKRDEYGKERGSKRDEPESGRRSKTDEYGTQPKKEKQPGVALKEGGEKKKDSRMKRESTKEDISRKKDTKNKSKIKGDKLKGDTTKREKTEKTKEGKPKADMLKEDKKKRDKTDKTKKTVTQEDIKDSKSKADKLKGDTIKKGKEGKVSEEITKKDVKSGDSIILKFKPMKDKPSEHDIMEEYFAKIETKAKEDGSEEDKKDKEEEDAAKKGTKAKKGTPKSKGKKLRDGIYTTTGGKRYRYRKSVEVIIKDEEVRKRLKSSKGKSKVTTKKGESKDATDQHTDIESQESISDKENVKPSKKKKGKEKESEKKEKSATEIPLKKKKPSSEAVLLLKMMKDLRIKREKDRESKKEKLKEFADLDPLPVIKRTVKPKLGPSVSESFIECDDHHLRKVQEMIIGKQVVAFDPTFKYKEERAHEPLLFAVMQSFPDIVLPQIEVPPPPPPVETKKRSMSSSISKMKSKSKTLEELGGGTAGIVKYQLSNRKYIEDGWTVLPTTKILRKMNTYNMKLANPEFDFFKINKKKKILFYDTGEKLAEIYSNECGKWFYRNGNLALHCYSPKEPNIRRRYIIYSSGDEIENGKFIPITILGVFDQLGNAIIYDHFGNARLKYNQTEGMIVDEKIGPPGRWKWHTLNDPPVLQPVFIDSYLQERDEDIENLIKRENAMKSDPSKTKDQNVDMIMIEFENFVKEKAHKLLQKFKPFQIRMKAVKINDHFSIRILDQASVTLIFQDTPNTLKLNLGLNLINTEIVDSETYEVSEVATPYDRIPARTESVQDIQEALNKAKKYGKSIRNRMYSGSAVKRPRDVSLHPNMPISGLPV